jgi:TonB family protein
MAVINVEGRVTEVEVKRSLESSLDQISVDTVRTWRFEPAKDKYGVAVAVHTPIEMHFQPRDSP